ncbi:MAG: hypothetical protein JWL97_4543 [Gemmatimonadales bacterium]|jgi:hypothetical protein|nr:hypothetical protein [Gemmatimonadales bacterium]
MHELLALVPLAALVVARIVIAFGAEGDRLTSLTEDPSPECRSKEDR